MLKNSARNWAFSLSPNLRRVAEEIPPPGILVRSVDIVHGVVHSPRLSVPGPVSSPRDWLLALSGQPLRLEEGLILSRFKVASPENHAVQGMALIDVVVDLSQHTVGAVSGGGAIIKDKLFYFRNDPKRCYEPSRGEIHAAPWNGGFYNERDMNMFTIAQELNSIQGTMSSIFVVQGGVRHRWWPPEALKHKKCLGINYASRPTNEEGGTTFGKSKNQLVVAEIVLGIAQ